MTPEQELAKRRQRFRHQCRLCRWGFIGACDRALAYPFLTFSDRQDVLRQRARTIRWRPFYVCAVVLAGAAVAAVGIGMV